jgi:hypothetical protein
VFNPGVSGRFEVVVRFPGVPVSHGFVLVLWFGMKPLAHECECIGTWEPVKRREDWEFY